MAVGAAVVGVAILLPIADAALAMAGFVAVCAAGALLVTGCVVFNGICDGVLEDLVAAAASCVLGDSCGCFWPEPVCAPLSFCGFAGLPSPGSVSACATVFAAGAEACSACCDVLPSAAFS